MPRLPLCHLPDYTRYHGFMGLRRRKLGTKRRYGCDRPVQMNGSEEGEEIGTKINSKIYIMSPHPPQCAGVNCRNRLSYGHALQLLLQNQPCYGVSNGFNRNSNLLPDTRYIFLTVPSRRCIVSSIRKQSAVGDVDLNRS